MAATTSSTTAGTARAKTWGPFTGRQLTTIICVTIVMALFPVAAWGISTSSVFLTDPHTNAHAAITKEGQLSTRVSGTVFTQVSPGASYNAVQLLDQTKSGCSPVTAPVPSGHALVVTSVTVTVKIVASGPVDADLYVGAACTQLAAGLTAAGPGQSVTLPLPSGLPIKPGHRLFVNLSSQSGNAAVLVDTNGFYAPSTQCTVAGPPVGCL
jgi:hypothetical protein